MSLTKNMQFQFNLKSTKDHAMTLTRTNCKYYIKQTHAMEIKPNFPNTNIKTEYNSIKQKLMKQCNGDRNKEHTSKTDKFLEQMIRKSMSSSKH